MEAVLVSAKRVGGTITVVTDKTGRYVFPQERLDPGKYNIMTRATGYNSPNPPKVVTIGKSLQELSLKLEKTKDLAAELLPN